MNLSTIDWLRERHANCIRIAETKTGLAQTKRQLATVARKLAAILETDL